MKRIKLPLIFLSVLSFGCLASDDLPEAPKSVVNESKLYCAEYAAEEGVSEKELKKSINKCVNDELVAQGYKKVDNLEDKQEI